MNEKNEEEIWPGNWKLVDGKLVSIGGGSGYDEAIEVPANKMDELRALIASGMPFEDAIRKCARVAFVWHDWDSPFYN